jgi:hypothetical protein
MGTAHADHRPVRPLLPLAVFSGSLLLSACTGSADETAASDQAATEIDSDLGEVSEANEESQIRAIADVARGEVKKSLDASTATPKIAARDAHPKAHGCVTANVKMAQSVPSDLAIGTFRPGKKYEAWIRFSNGSKQDDRERDARGMAIKLMGVDEGDRVLATEAPGTRTHDIVLTNHHTFFLKDVKTYVDFMESATNKGNPLSMVGFLLTHPIIGVGAFQFVSQPISSPITSNYYSATPYKLGSQVVKYKAKPCDGADRSGAHVDDPDYLKKALRADLALGGGCFELQIQRQKDTGLSLEDAVEDASQAWGDDPKNFVTVGRIEIPAQQDFSAKAETFCENLSFTPWHARSEHRPLGRVNRTRKAVYEATSEERHRLNGVARTEPTSLKIP